MNYCSYYQATISRRECWFFVAILHSYDHLSFDRTLDIENSVFEFFVPESTESEFLNVIQEMTDRGLVSDFKKLPNRLVAEDSSVWQKIQAS
jgi:hypothetical protein